LGARSLTRIYEAEAANTSAAMAASGLTRLYSPDEHDPTAVGAFIARAAEGVGATFEVADVQTMHRSLVVGVLDANPSPEEEQTGNEGHRAMTSDNALVYGHRIDESGYVAAEYGAMVRTLSGGYNVFRDEHKLRVRAPTDLHLPVWPPHLDGELIDAVHRSLTIDSDEARRLGRAIDWLDLAWRNAQALTVDLRIIAVRSGFEILFGTDDTVALRGALSGLLEPPDVKREPRVWKNLRGNLRAPEELTGLEWWWMQFTFLRNRIVHGGAIDIERYMHGDHSHLDLGVYRLGEAVKARIVASGYPYLTLTLHERALFRAMRKHGIKPPLDEPTTD
jgi:hypothetical protein